MIGFQGTIHSRQITPTRLHSATADNIAWSKYATPTSDTHIDPALRDALSRIHFSDTYTPEPLHTAIRHARTLRETSPRLLILTGRSKRLAKESHDAEMKRVMETYRSGVGVEVIRRTIGDVGAAMLVGVGSPSGVVVAQAAEERLEGGC